MIQILFSGTGQMLSKLQAVLRGYAVVAPMGNADIHICEVRGGDDLKRIPKKTSVPIFLIVATQEKQIVEQLRSIRINGIFFPPLDGETIKKKLNTVLNINIQKPDIEDIDSLKIKLLAKAESINSLPVFAQKLLSLTTKDSSTITEITNQIKMDQGISSKVIRMVNSPFFGLRQDVNSIDRAVVLLGFQTVKNIALVAATNIYYNKPFSMYRTTGAAMWQHAYVVALLSETFASHTNQDPDSLFLAGLLHDIGKTVMVDFLKHPVQDTAEERKQLGTDHSEVAAMILNRWQFTNDIIQIVRTHHMPDQTMGSLVVYCANMISHLAHDDYLLKQIIDNTVEKMQCTEKPALCQKLFDVVIQNKEQR